MPRIIKRKKDYAESKTDEMLSDLEKRIEKEYRTAYNEVSEKYLNFIEGSAVREKEKLRQLQEGKITEADFKKWKEGQVFIGKRWSDMADELAQDLTKVDKKALSMTNGFLPDAYALNHNYATYEVEKRFGINSSYTLYSRETVERLLRDDPNLLPKRKVDVPKDKRWNKQHINSAITQGVLQGDDLRSISKRLLSVTDMDKTAAIRNARTMMTGAQNSGRIDAMKRMKGIGVNVKKEWIATLDHHTRASHGRLDGEIVDIDKKFSNGCMYPGDPNGLPAEVYNCRCTIGYNFPEYPDEDVPRYDNENQKRIKGMTYTQWAGWKKEKPHVFSLFDVGDAPKRPLRTDYITAETLSDEYWKQYEEFEKAREEYKKQREEYEPKLERFVSESISIPYMTVSDMEEWCKKNNVHIYGDISEVDGRALTAFTRRTEQLFKEFPMVQEYRKDHGYMGKFNVSFENNGSFLAEASTGFTFGRQFKNFENVIRFEVASDEGVTEKRYRVLGDGTVNQVFDHEFGHNLYSAMKYKGFKTDEYGGMTREQHAHLEALRKDLIENVYKKSGMSEYAGTNDDELFAEAFSAWHGGEKTDFANAMGDFLKRHGVIK